MTETQEPQTPAQRISHWQSVVKKLDSRSRTVRENLAQYRETRDAHVLPAATGDAQARGELDGLDTKIADAEREIERLALAVEQARGNLAAAEAEQRTDEQAARDARARECATALLRRSRDVDDIAKVLASALAQRKQVAEVMLAELPRDTARKLRDQLLTHHAIGAALCAAGLGDFASINSLMGRRQAMRETDLHILSVYELLAETEQAPPSEEAAA